MSWISPSKASGFDLFLRKCIGDNQHGWDDEEGAGRECLSAHLLHKSSIFSPQINIQMNDHFKTDLSQSKIIPEGIIFKKVVSEWKQAAII